MVVKMVFPDIFPNMFHWHQLGTVGRLKNQTNVLRDNETV
jgi:hypothetical protein